MASGGAEIGSLEGLNPSQADQDQIARLKSIDRVIHDAKRASEREKKMTLWEGIKLYPKAIGWSVLISTCIVMVTAPSTPFPTGTYDGSQPYYDTPGSIK